MIKGLDPEIESAARDWMNSKREFTKRDLYNFLRPPVYHNADVIASRLIASEKQLGNIEYKKTNIHGYWRVVSRA